ncbi:DUF3299 domain-containing protein [Parvularcula marina]|uniref:DUF3299 domain-containing protein n=1 Tax=Parvularcula marina TaxID=2292771 RepID=A0A371RKB1_9PROT|nr:DUF3299 domain-containing protein [Parvularcula marina]RFB05883.1 DUF3299 domain-containing protein [Parvularcula marina]
MTPSARPRLISLLFIAACLISSCNRSDAGAENSPPADSAVLTLDWDDLLPEGEEEVLDELYTEFYIDLDRRIAQLPQQTLSEAARNGDMGIISEGSDLDEMPQLGTYNVVEDLDGEHVRLPGFIVPLEYDAREKLRTFLLVPYFGACIHTPPPPPNQLVFVTTDEPIKVKDIWDAFWVEGIITTGRFENDLGNSAYSLKLISLKPFE